MDVAGTIIPILAGVGAISLFAAIITCAHINELNEYVCSKWTSDETKNYAKQEIEKKKKATGYALYAGITCILLVVFIPSERTIMRMLIAENLTPARIEKAGELTEKTIDKIIEKIINARFEKK